MKKIISIVFFAIFVISSAVHAGQVILSWDPNPEGSTPDGYRIYQRDSNQNVYDYSSYIWPKNGDDPLSLTCTVMTEGPALPDPLPAYNLFAVWDKDASTVTLTWDQDRARASKTYLFVARSYIGDDESNDSNEVSYEDTTENPTDHWIIYFSEKSGGPYTELDVLERLAGVERSVTSPLTVVEPGQIKPIYFVVVTFGKNETFSINSEEASVLVDRRGPPVPPINFRVGVVVPVQ